MVVSPSYAETCLLNILQNLSPTYGRSPSNLDTYHSLFARDCNLFCVTAKTIVKGENPQKETQNELRKNERRAG